jgi:all-trans-8'-apo-beta-carotenal 15,15'-oxygenase
VVDLVRYPDYRVIGEALRTYWRSGWPCAGMAALTRLRIDLGSGKVASTNLAAGAANEFPTINPSRVGKRYRYAYIACHPAGRAQGLQQQVARVDVENGTAAIHDFGPNGYVGEPLFVPTGDGEDDGVVVTLVFDAADQRTAVVGLDARDLGARPLFTARLKHHVPYPLHGFFARAS